MIGGDDPLLTIILFLLWWLQIGETVFSDAPPAVAAARQADGGPLVYVATQDAFPDALAVAGITGLTQGYTVLIDPDDPAGNAALLDRLVPREIVIIGGTAAIPDSAIPEDGTPRRRLGGASRFDTAALLSREHFGPGVSTAYIATGNNYPDALAGGAAASVGQAPILLVDQGTIPGATATELQRLAPGRIVVLGGPAVIPETVVEQLRAYTGGQVTRLAGADRTETAVEISRASFPAGVDVVVVANAEDFRNAEGAAGAAWSTGAPLLLVRPNGPLPAHVRSEIARLDPDRIAIVASAGELSEATLQELETLP